MITSRMSFVNKIGIVLKATSDDECPTAGYLYKEINNISFESGGSNDSLLEFLGDRLNSKSCHVKFKVLKLMKHVLENGSREFQLGIRKYLGAIRECTKFGGPPHPLHGNVPYLMVRKMSKELYEAICNMEQGGKPLTDATGPDRPPEPKYGGLGPVQAGGSIQGFGNTPPHPKTLGETILDGIEKLGAKMLEKPSDRQAALLAKLDLSSSTINYRPPAIVGGSQEPVFTAQQPEETSSTLPKNMWKPVKKPQPGRAGGGWGDNDDEEAEDIGEEENTENINDNGSKQLSIETDSLIDHTNRPQTEELQADWKEESELVLNVLKHGSTGEASIYLSPSNIAAFLSKCSLLSCDKIVEILAQKLASRDAGIVLRSLQLLEGIIYNKEELVSIDLLTLMCKEALVSCYLNGHSQYQTSTPSKTLAENLLFLNEEQLKTPDLEPQQSHTMSAVHVKLAKVILILQQLSSHKEILSSSHFNNYLKNMFPVLDSSDI